MTTEQLDRFADQLADDIERELNTGHRCYAVERAALKAAYRAAHARLFANHDPGDEDRSAQ